MKKSTKRKSKMKMGPKEVRRNVRNGKANIEEEGLLRNDGESMLPVGARPAPLQGHLGRDCEASSAIILFSL